jgi:hypothetical protein
VTKNTPAENAPTAPSAQPTPPAGAPLERSGPIFAALTGLTALAILLQAVFAGEFVDRAHEGGWLTAHDVNANVAIALAVITAIYALVVLRESARPLAIGAVALAVLVAAQAAIGHAVTDGSHDWLLVIHIPLALLVFALTIWLSVHARVAHGRARLTAVGPRGAGPGTAHAR